MEAANTSVMHRDDDPGQVMAALCSESVGQGQAVLPWEGRAIHFLTVRLLRDEKPQCTSERTHVPTRCFFMVPNSVHDPSLSVLIKQRKKLGDE